MHTYMDSARKFGLYFWSVHVKRLVLDWLNEGMNELIHLLGIDLYNNNRRMYLSIYQVC